MKPKHRKNRAESYETITAPDPFGIGVTLTVIRSNHKSLRRGAEHLNRAHAALQREETLLLKEYRAKGENPSILSEAQAEHEAAQAVQKRNKKAEQIRQMFRNDTSTQAERDHETLYQLDPDYRKASDDLQDKHLSLIQTADQLDVAARVRKWEGEGIEAGNEWKGGEDLERIRSVLFDGWGDEDEVYLIPAFLDAEGNELEEGGELEAEATRLSAEIEETLEENKQKCSALYADLCDVPTGKSGTDVYNHNLPVMTAFRTMSMRPTSRPFGHFKRRCLEGVPQENAAAVTDVAAAAYERFQKLEEEEEQAKLDHDNAVAKAGLRSTGTFTQFDERTGKEIRTPFAGYADRMAFGLWVMDLSLQAERAFEKKSRRGTSKQ